MNAFHNELKEILQLKTEYINEIERMKERKVFLFGAGATAEFNLNYMRKLGINVIAFVDNDLKKIGTRIQDVEIVSLDCAITMEPRGYYYITTQMYYKPIKDQILEAGILFDNISQYDIIIQLPWEKNFREEFELHFDDYVELGEALQDKKSKEVLINRIKFLLTRKRDYATIIRDYIQYFDKDVWTPKEKEVFVDAGVFDGDTIREFIRFSNSKYKSIVGFEMDGKYACLARKNLQDWGNIEIVTKGLHNINGKMEIISGLGMMNSLEETFSNEASMENSHNQTIEVCSIDSFFKNRDFTPTVIKMDIEGAEMNALLGAKRTIVDCKPKMLICVYHCKEDIIHIWKYLRECNPSYKFFLRHYSDNSTETVLFAV